MKEYNELRAQFGRQDKSKVKFKKQNNMKSNYKDYLMKIYLKNRVFKHMM